MPRRALLPGDEARGVERHGAAGEVAGQPLADLAELAAELDHRAAVADAAAEVGEQVHDGGHHHQRDGDGHQHFDEGEAAARRRLEAGGWRLEAERNARRRTRVASQDAAIRRRASDRGERRSAAVRWRAWHGCEEGSVAARRGTPGRGGARCCILLHRAGGAKSRKMRRGWRRRLEAGGRKSEDAAACDATLVA